jgi:VCBS repeat-containing protein
VTVTDSNHAPVAATDTYSATEATTLTISAAGVLANDTDSDGDALSAVLVAGPSHGTLTLNTNGSFTYTPTTGFTGTDSFTYKASDGEANSNVATVNLMVNPVNTVLITAAWLAAQGAGPYLLTQANTNYVLQTDVTVDGTAFVVGEANITLDLNGHTVTYGNAAPVTVQNGGFELGSVRNVPGWDITNAPTAKLAPNDSYLFGTQVLRLESFSTAQTIVSDPISIPVAGHTYVAHITPGARGDYRTAMELSVIDGVTGEVLATSTRGNAERGILTPAKFTPTTTNPVRLKLVVTPAAGVTTTVDLDDAVVARSYDYGIMATREWSGQLPGYSNLSNAAKAAYNKVNNFALRNGNVQQGQAHGYGSVPLMFSELLNGLTVENVTVFCNGLDTTGLLAGRLGHGVDSPRDIVIANNTFQFDVHNVTDRMYGPSAISASGEANIRIEGNHIFNAPQYGITGGTPEDFIFLIKGNEIRHRAVVANGYAISVTALQNFEIADNTIITQNGRGIMIDGYSATPTEHGRIHGNYVDVQEGFNREYLISNEARALRMRNNVDAQGPHRDIAVYDNSFIARTGPGLATEAYAARISYVNINGQMDNAGIVIRNNVFRAITDDPSRPVMAFVLDGTSQGINTVVSDNVFESNDTSLQILGSDGGDSYDTRFVSNTIRKSDDGSALEHKGISVGYSVNQAHQISLIDTRFENGATSRISFVGSGAKDLNLGWLLGLVVKNAAGESLVGASVKLFDREDHEVFSGTTSQAGEISNIEVVTQVLTQDISKYPTIATSVDNRGPHRLEISLNGYPTYYRTIDLVHSTQLDVVL